MTRPAKQACENRVRDRGLCCSCGGLVRYRCPWSPDTLSCPQRDVTFCGCPVMRLRCRRHSTAQPATTLSGDWRMPVREHLQPHLTRVRSAPTSKWDVQSLPRVLGAELLRRSSASKWLNGRTAAKRRPGRRRRARLLWRNRSGNVHRSRHALNADTIREMHAAFRRGGHKAIDKVMKQQPAVFLKLFARCRQH
jgi:hypothetical protein